jgi:hypothetical protein
MLAIVLGAFALGAAAVVVVSKKLAPPPSPEKEG